MRVLMVNWPKVWFGARRGGVNGYTQSLALRLIEEGHEVITLCSGTTRTDNPTPNPHTRVHKPWRGIRVVEIIDSPVLAPGKRQFDDPLAEASSPALEELCRQIAADLDPDIVHVQALEGLSAPCVQALASRGAKSVFSLHNYHTVCPEVYLKQGKRIPCNDFDQGRACENCISKFDTEATDKRGAPPTDPVPWPTDSAQIILARAPITNARPPEPPLHEHPTPYAVRRAAMVDALNACSRVHAVSSFVRDCFEGMGVETNRIITTPIGVEIIDRVMELPSAMFEQRPDPETRPLRMSFIGFHSVYKGLDVLLDALDTLPPAVLSRIHLCVHAPGSETVAHRLARLDARLARLTHTAEYTPEDVPHLLAGADLGIVPSTFWDPGPQTVFEMLACRVPVLASAVGGIPDVITDDVNGLLVPGNDPSSLADAIARVVDDPSMLARFRAAITLPKSMREHAREIIDLYLSLPEGAAA